MRKIMITILAMTCSLVLLPESANAISKTWTNLGPLGNGDAYLNANFWSKEKSFVGWQINEVMFGDYVGFLSKDGKAFWINGVKLSSNQTEVVIPAKVNGITVTKVESYDLYDETPNLFYCYPRKTTEESYIDFYCGSKITKITLPDTITEMGDETFQEMGKLGKVTLSKNLKKMGADIFAKDKNLKSIKLPSRVKTIEADAFRDAGLTSLAIAKKNPYFSVKKGVLYSKKGTKLYLILDKVKTVNLGKKVTSLGLNREDVTEDGKKAAGWPDLASRKVTISKKNKVFAKKGNSVYKKKTGELLFYLDSVKDPHIASGIKKMTDVQYGEYFRIANHIYLPKSLRVLDLNGGLAFSTDYLCAIHIPAKKQVRIKNVKYFSAFSENKLKLYVPKKLVKAYKRSLGSYLKYCTVCAE